MLSDVIYYTVYSVIDKHGSFKQIEAALHSSSALIKEGATDWSLFALVGLSNHADCNLIQFAK